MKMIKSIFISFIFMSLITTHLYSNNKIKILRAGEYPPYHYSKKNKKNNNNISHKGFLIEVLKETSKLSGIDIEFIYEPSWTRCLHYIKNKKYDAITPIFKTKKRINYMYFFKNSDLIKEINVFAVKKKSNIKYSGNLASLKEYKIGYVKGYNYDKKFDSYNNLHKIPVTNDEKLVKLLFTKKRYDLIIGNYYVLKYFAIKNKSIDRISFLHPPLSKKSTYIGFSKIKEKKELYKRFIKYLSKFKNSEKYKKLRKKFFKNINKICK